MRAHCATCFDGVAAGHCASAAKPSLLHTDYLQIPITCFPVKCQTGQVTGLFVGSRMTGDHLPLCWIVFTN